jgi:hypothetical protein
VIFSFEVLIGFAAVSPLGQAHTRGKADADKYNRMGLKKIGKKAKQARVLRTCLC